MEVRSHDCSIASLSRLFNRAMVENYARMPV
jgi:hypothetical protein